MTLGAASRPSLSLWGTSSSSSGTQVAPALRVPAFQAFCTQQPSGVASFHLPSPHGLRLSPALSVHAALWFLNPNSPARLPQPRSLPQLPPHSAISGRCRKACGDFPRDLLPGPSRVDVLARNIGCQANMTKAFLSNFFQALLWPQLWDFIWWNFPNRDRRVTHLHFLHEGQSHVV